MSDTAVDRLLADPRLAQVLNDVVTRVQAGTPIRWHRLLHATQGQLHASPDLALCTGMQWRLAQAGIETTLVSEWLATDVLPLTLIVLAILAMVSTCAVLLVGIYRAVCELVTLAQAQDDRERQRETPAAPAPH